MRRIVAHFAIVGQEINVFTQAITVRLFSLLMINAGHITICAG